ncbi:GNAT family N-acetyltransferase [Aliidiomarina soli]|uniref:N-acetyltransferase domain-containing protein n=1 Tax=Aliidiomarina soli TaxID=1928574 RepID=A0A432WGG1_9GAMM|nr:GNAT family N-acetyltransferase [Aliidiomarina soli]RUO32916.1 hypothetical protein CWE14_06620 [Aliidiomarina soli]
MQLYQAIEQLLQQAASNHWRGLLVLQGDSTAPLSQVQWPQPALCMGGDYPVPLKSYRAYLGRAYSCVVLDFRQQQHADALAALAGTLVAGGLLVLQVDRQLSPFLKHLLQRQPAGLYIKHQLQPDETIDLRGLPLPSLDMKPGTQLSAEQTEVLNALLEHQRIYPDQPALISAPRGRGKSTVLGALARRLLEANHPVIISAPSRRQAEVVLRHGHLPITEASSPPRFVAPDALLADDAEPCQGTLLLDEAANLPRHMLEKLLQRYPGVIMATTTQGYECCGRGFLIQFQKTLQQRFTHARQLTLTEPFRYASGCPLEEWLEQRLLLQNGENEQLPGPAYSEQALKYIHSRASALDEAELTTCFSLLMDAHYQTSANDLKLLLDDEQQSLLLQYSGEQLTGVAWLAEEGCLPAGLADDIVAGRRRPPGSLLPQLLARHLRDPSIASTRMLRVVRIAVRPSLQQQGLGSALLGHIDQLADQTGTALIGTSFGASAELVCFWNHNGYQSVRLGSRPDTVSGRYACVCVKASDVRLAPSIAQWAAFFQHELPGYVQLLKLNYGLQQQLASAATTPFAPHQESYQTLAHQRLLDFANGQFDFPSLLPTLLVNPEWLNASHLLACAAVNQAPPETLQDHYNIHGRKDLLKALRQICFELSVKI